jgi:Icc-related predicted phosphoesterase
MKILALSDTLVPFVYSPQVRNRFQEIDLLLGCGDLPYYYLEYVLNALDRPLFFVRGNHDWQVEHSNEGPRSGPPGGMDLHGRHIVYKGLLMAGIEGSLRYRNGPYQYTQREMWIKVLQLIPGLIRNRARYGRYLDLFLTHAPPHGVHDRPDLPHQGIQAFRWLVETFRPTYLVHGHVHVYRPDTPVRTRLGKTMILNAFAYQEFEIPVGSASK